jgi:hypothetical protein
VATWNVWPLFQVGKLNESVYELIKYRM